MMKEMVKNSQYVLPNKIAPTAAISFVSNLQPPTAMLGGAECMMECGLPPRDRNISGLKDFINTARLLPVAV